MTAEAITHAANPTLSDLTDLPVVKSALARKASTRTRTPMSDNLRGTLATSGTGKLGNIKNDECKRQTGNDKQKGQPCLKARERHEETSYV